MRSKICHGDTETQRRSKNPLALLRVLRVLRASVARQLCLPWTSCWIAIPKDEPPSLPDVSIQVATPDEARVWFEQDGAGGDWADPDGLAFMLIRCTLKSETQLFLAWRNGRAVGGGALEIHNGVAALMAAGTHPAFRNQGIHTALLRSRLAAAVEAGCDLAMVHTQPGAVSQRNVLRARFQLVYTVDMMVSST